MRAAVLRLCLLSPALAAVGLRAQTVAPRKAPTVAPVTKAAVAPAVPPPAAAQSANPWKAILRVVPNPLPAGRCATAAVEIQDPDGYRATTLSNGSVIDFHQFVYKSSDNTAFNWQDGNPIFGVICAPATATAAHTTISVTLPDGLAASVDLATVAPGASAAPVVYPPQGRLRPAGLASAQLQTVPAAAAAQPTQPPPSLAGAGPPIGVADPASSGSAQWLGTLTIGGSTIPAQLISGGSVTADVVTSQLATISNVTKHVGNVTFVPMVLSVQPSSTLATWINSAWSGSPTRMDGTVNAQPAGMTSVAGRLAFTSGLITSTRIPELPSTSGLGALTVGVSPEVLRAATSGPTAASIKSEPITGFRFSVSGITTGTVVRIASFEVATTVPSSASAESRESQRVPFRPVFPDLYISIDERTAQDWIAWYNAMIIGQTIVADQKTFTLELLAANTATPVATIKGYGVGIVSLRANPMVNGKQTLEAELYVTRMEFLAPGSK